MALLQALIAFVGRSAGKILYAIFGWAVRALFGYTSGARRNVLTGVVALAALWPLLLLGVAAPRVAAFALAFVPLPDRWPDAWIRAAWIALALVIPALVGIALALEAPPGAARESRWLRIARGYPITLGIATAFWIAFVSVPLQRIAAAARGLADAYIPLVTTPASYPQAAQRIAGVLDDHGFALRACEPGFWTVAPLRVLRALGGSALRGFVPERLAYFRSSSLVAMLHPTGLLLRGNPETTALAHGLAAEALTASEAHQTTDAEAQQLEREIQRVWRVLAQNPVAHRASPWLLGRSREIARDLTALKIPYDDWQIVYRQILQLERAVRGEPQILANDDAEVDEMSNEIPGSDGVGAELPLSELLREITNKAALLARKEIELARAEIRKDFESERAMAKGLGVAAVFAITTLDMLLVAAVFALARSMDGWLAALLVAGGTLLVTVVAAAVGWRKRVTRPLERTRQSLAEDVKWAKERLA